MANEDGNPDTGIGLHEATLAISNLLGPEEDNQEQAEALSQEEAEPQEEAETQTTGEETEAEEYEEYDEAEESDPEEEDYGEEEPTQELPEDLTVKVKVDGEEMEVSLAELRNGYSRTADYTRKSTALAEQRKQIESEIETIRNERALYQELLPKLQAQIEQQISQEPDWDSLYNDDPIEAARLERHWRTHKEEQAKKLQAIEAEQQRLSQAQLAEQQAQMQARLAEERGKLTEVIPEWKDQTVMAREAQELRDWAPTVGLSEQEVNSLTQASHIALIRKAMLYDKGARKVEASKKPASKKGRVVKPGSSNGSSSRRAPELKRASQRLARTGRVSDAAALIDKLI